MNRHVQSELVWGPLRNEKCKLCPLHKEAQSVCLLGDGPVPCEAMVIGEAPGFREDDIQIPFSGKSGIFLRQQLKEVGLDPRKIFITNVVACRPPMNRTPTRKEANTCGDLYLRRQIELVRPRVALLLGATAISWARGKKTAVGSSEGSTFNLDGMTCVPSRHPSAVLRSKGDDSFPFHVQAFKENLILFKNTLYPKEDTFKFFKDLSSGCEETEKPVYTDLESDGLNPFRPESKIHCIGFCQLPGRVSAKMLESGDEKTVRNILRTHHIIAHRTTFEGTWYRRHYGVTPRIYYDTKVGAYLRNENEPSGLKYQAVRYLGVDPWSEEQDFKNPDPKKLLPYNARDNSYGMRLYREIDLPFLKKNPKTARLLRYLLLPGIEVLIEIICNGYHIDIEKAKKNLIICQAEKNKLNKKLNKIAGRELNPGSPKQMSKLFYEQLGLKCPIMTAGGKSGIPKPSTSEAALIRLVGQHPATDLLWEWRGWEKKESTYLEPWIRQGPVLHAIYDPTGTDTGRLASSMVKNKRKEKGMGAVIHQCPRDPFIRSLVSPRGYSPSGRTDSFVPKIQWFGKEDRKPSRPRPEDWCIVEFDWSQIELRLVAHAAEEQTMMDVFNADGDIHLTTAMNVLKLQEDQIDKETRKKAKAVNFGFVYGMFAPKFQIYCLEKFDLRISLKDAKDYRRAYFKKYSGLGPWHRRVEAFVSQNGYIDSVFGRRRHLPGARHDSGLDEWMRREAIRQAINSPIQGAGSDLMLLLFSLIASYSMPWDFKIDRKRAFFVGTAHDSALAEVHKSYVKEFKAGIEWTVQNLPTEKYFDFKFNVPIRGDFTIYDDCWKGKILEI